MKMSAGIQSPMMMVLLNAPTAITIGMILTPMNALNAPLHMILMVLAQWAATALTIH